MHTETGNARLGATWDDEGRAAGDMNDRMAALGHARGDGASGHRRVR